MLFLNIIIVNFLERLDESAEVKFMIQSGPQYWKWLDRDDIILYKWFDVKKN